MVRKDKFIKLKNVYGGTMEIDLDWSKPWFLAIEIKNEFIEKRIALDLETGELNEE